MRRARRLGSDLPAPLLAAAATLCYGRRQVLLHQRNRMQAIVPCDVIGVLVAVLAVLRILSAPLKCCRVFVRCFSNTSWD